MGAGPHRSGYNRRRKSQTIKLLPKKNSALLLLSSRSEKKGRNISLSLVAFLSEMDVIFDDARQVQRGTPSKHFNHIASSPRVCGRVAQWTTQRVNTKILATCIFSEGKREEGSHPCAMSDALSLLYDSLAIWLFFFLLLPTILLLSVDWPIGFRWWMVREEHRQVTLLFSYVVYPWLWPAIPRIRARNWLFFSFSIYLFHTFSFHFVVTVPKEKEEEERISGLYPAAGHSNV